MASVGLLKTQLNRVTVEITAEEQVKANLEVEGQQCVCVCVCVCTHTCTESIYKSAVAHYMC